MTNHANVPKQSSLPEEVARDSLHQLGYLSETSGSMLHNGICGVMFSFLPRAFGHLMRLDIGSKNDVPLDILVKTFRGSYGSK